MTLVPVETGFSILWVCGGRVCSEAIIEFLWSENEAAISLYASSCLIDSVLFLCIYSEYAWLGCSCEPICWVLANVKNSWADELAQLPRVALSTLSL